MKPNYNCIDNDLKYRYIKMKGDETPERIAELEETFELNRDNAKIRRMKKNVEEYERTVKQKVQLEEQTRLKQQAVKALDNKVNEMKSK